MELKKLFADDDAVSPVIGVILMVAITVILAAVIGAFVLDLGGGTQKTPQTSFNFDQKTETVEIDDDSSGSATEQDIKVVSVTHESGDTLSESSIQVAVGGTQGWDIEEVSGTNQSAEIWNSGNEINAGSSVSVGMYSSDATGSENLEDTSGTGSDITVNLLTSGDSVQVLWESEDGSSTATLQDYEVQ
jgi:flagellin-like protein